MIAPLVESISKDEDYAPYIRALKPVVLARLLQSLSEVYSTISISYVMGLVKPFASGPWETNEKDLETFLMGASQRGELGVAVDHISKAITFQHEQAVKPVVLSEVSNLQDVAATGQSSQIARLALALQNTIHHLNPSILEDAKAARASAFAQALAEAEEERKAAAHRRTIVDRRRQKLEEINSRRQREENDAKVLRARQAADEAAAREAEAYKQRERDRVQKEIDTIRNAEAKKLAETLKARGGLKVDVESMEDLDTDKLLKLQSAQIAKEQKNIAERMRIISKRVDHLERAFRKEERPLLEQDYETQKTADKEAHKAAIQAAQQAASEKHHLDLALKSRLSRMLADYQQSKEIIESARQEEFAQRKAEADKKIAEEKKAYREKVLKERADRRRREEEERQAQEQAEREEEGESSPRFLAFCAIVHFAFIFASQNVLPPTRKPRLLLRPRPKPMLPVLPSERLSERLRGKLRSRLLESESKPRRNEKEGDRRPLPLPVLLLRLLPVHRPLPDLPKVVVDDSSLLLGVSLYLLKRLFLLLLDRNLPLPLPRLLWLPPPLPQLDLPLPRPVRGLPGVLPPLPTDLPPTELPHRADLPRSEVVVRGETEWPPRKLLVARLRTLLLRLLPVDTGLPLEGRYRTCLYNVYE